MNFCGQDCETHYSRGEVLSQYFLIDWTVFFDGVHTATHWHAAILSLVLAFQLTLLSFVHGGGGWWWWWIEGPMAEPRRGRTSLSHVICESCLVGRGWGAAEKNTPLSAQHPSLCPLPFLLPTFSQRKTVGGKIRQLTMKCWHPISLWCGQSSGVQFYVKCVCVCLGRLSVHMANHVNKASIQHSLIFPVRNRFSSQFWVLY